MRLTLTALGVTLAVGAALAQTTPGTARPAAPAPGADSSTGARPGTGVVDRNRGAAAAGGDRNQAVATTDANAAEPARGASSFTEGQARGRFEDKGYTGVTSLAKGDDGVWRGTATKGGASVQVWLDYKGNIGQAAGGAAKGAAMTGTSR